MCLITEQNEPKIAEKNMLVYKALDCTEDGLFSIFYYNTRWVLNKTYWMKNMGIQKERVYFGVRKGFHAYTKKIRILDHFSFSFMRTYDLDIRLFEAIIPKGSKYLISYDTFEIVSNKIRIIKEVENV